MYACSVHLCRASAWPGQGVIMMQCRALDCPTCHISCGDVASLTHVHIAAGSKGPSANAAHGRALYWLRVSLALKRCLKQVIMSFFDRHHANHVCQPSAHV